MAKTSNVSDPVAKSFDAFLKHFKLIKKISEKIWAAPDCFSADHIRESRIMNQLWTFVSYCEAYFEDCVLVKRAHFNLHMVLQIFQNTVNNSVRDRQKNLFKAQREALLTGKKVSSGATSFNGDMSTHSFSDRHSLMSQSLLSSSDIEGTSLSVGSGFPPSSPSVDPKKALENLYRTLR